MTLAQIYTEVLNKLRMESGDMEPNIEAQIKHSINEAYKLVAGKYKTIQIDYLPVIQSLVELPKNVIGTIEFEPKLDPKLDRMVGDNIKTNREDGTVFTVKYYATPQKLEADTDAPNVPERLMEALVVFPCYIYFVSKKRLDLASEYKSQFDTLMNGADVQHEFDNDYITNIYESFFY